MRDITLPRRLISSKSGRRARICIWRRRLVVPIFAPRGKACNDEYFILNKASLVFAREQTQASSKPGSKRVGTSFRLWTAMWACPLNRAFSSSFVKSPLPPIFASGVSKITSPFVFIVISSTSWPFWRNKPAICSLCHKARADARVATFIFICLAFI